MTVEPASPSWHQRLARGFRNLVLQVAAVTLGFVMSVNFLVRNVGGGDTQPLSTRRMDEKFRALGMLGAHMLVHSLRTDESDTRAIVAEAARRNGVNPDLALKVAQAESSFRPHAISATGAMGLMQLMPNTAREYGVRDPFDARQNADGGTQLLHDLTQRYRGDFRRVLAAYNAGPGRVPRHGPYHVPPSTRGYVSRILRH